MVGQVLVALEYGTPKLPFEHFLDALFWKQNEKVERFFKNDFSITVAAD